MKKFIHLAVAVTVAGAALLATAGPASAHVGIEEGEQQAGAYTVLSFGVGHGCEGSPTTKLEIQVPESVLSVTPTRNAYYDVEVEVEELADPVTGSHGEEITTRDAVVVYTAKDPLSDGIRDALELSLQIPEDAAGTTLYFPTVQTCEEGSTAWIELPEDGDDGSELDEPAPSVAVVEASGDGGSGDGSGESASAESTGSGSAGASENALVDAQPVSDDDGTDTLAVVALIVGALGLIVGTGGFVIARRKA